MIKMDTARKAKIAYGKAVRDVNGPELINVFGGWHNAGSRPPFFWAETKGWHDLGSTEKLIEIKALRYAADRFNKMADLLEKDMQNDN